MLTSLFYVTGEFYGSYTQDEPTGNQSNPAWINKLSTRIDPVPVNFDPAISPVGEDIETREINVQLTLKTQM